MSRKGRFRPGFSPHAFGLTTGGLTKGATCVELLVLPFWSDHWESTLEVLPLADKLGGAWEAVLVTALG